MLIYICVGMVLVSVIMLYLVKDDDKMRLDSFLIALANIALITLMLATSA